MKLKTIIYTVSAASLLLPLAISAPDDDSGSGAGTTGVNNKLQDRSNQLENGPHKNMDTDNFYPPSVSIWNDSDGSQDSADQWAITPDYSWVIDNRGNPYPSYNTYYRSPSQERTSVYDDDIDKRKKVFGNSFGAVATSNIGTDDNGNEIMSGDGFWIDPDDLKKYADMSGVKVTSGGPWQEELSFKMDLTGDDSGIGMDTGSFSCRDDKNDKCRVRTADIYFKGEESGNVHPSLEPPVCGDDENEYLIEQMGESVDSDQYDGSYACLPNKNTCPHERGNNLIERGSYLEASERDEDDGRLKNDIEICAKRTNNEANRFDWQPVFYDQDYGDFNGDGVQDTCRENSFYGEEGVRWISEQYVEKHPEAVTGGIDDDWNEYLDRIGHDSYSSSPGAGGWSDSETPVPSGSTSYSKTATKGFCGGDDQGEYLVTQKCRSNLCSTQNAVKGVAKIPEACVIDRGRYSALSGDDRELFSPGENVTFDLSGGNQKDLRCFSGTWYDQWPVVAEHDTKEITVGSEENVDFNLINPTQEEKQYEVTISGDLVTEFKRNSKKSAVVSVDPQGSKTVSVMTTGTAKGKGGEITVTADARFADLDGEDKTDVSIVEGPSPDTGSTPSDVNDVPGITFVQMATAALLAASYMLIS